MIFTLNILIDICLIFAVWKTFKRCDKSIDYHYRSLKSLKGVLRSYVESVTYAERDYKRKLKNMTNGFLGKYLIKTKLAEKTADRAFNMASSANLATVALAKALQAPRIMTKEQGQRNEIAKKQIDALFSGEDIMDFLKPIASEEELLAIETIQENKRKEMQNGKHKP